MRKIFISTENAEYQIIQSLKLHRLKRNKLGEIFIEGIECVKQAVKSNTEITRIIIRDTDNLSDWGRGIIEQNQGSKIIEMSDALYKNLADKTEPSEMLVTAKITPNTINDIHSENPFVLVFDRPSDHGNLGSVIRSANAFNVDGIFIIGHGIDIYEPKVIRASLGSIFFTKIVTLDSMAVLSDYIRNQKAINNMSVIGTDSAGAVSIENCELKKPIMIIIGNEAKGMSRGLKEICDKTVSIPMEGSVNSLNVSCAASVIMWEIFRNRR